MSSGSVAAPSEIPYPVQDVGETSQEAGTPRDGAVMKRQCYPLSINGVLRGSPSRGPGEGTGP